MDYINTIFYFAGSQEEYNARKLALLIEPRTISFVPNGDGKTGSIYKAGIKYSGDITDSINTLVSWDGKYHTGTNIGDLIVNDVRMPIWVPASSGSDSGSGSGSGISDDQQAAIDRLNDAIKILRNGLDEVKNTADSESKRLDTLFSDIDAGVTRRFEDMLNDSEFLKNVGYNWYSNFGQDPTDREIERYLQMLGFVEETDDGKVYKTWTEIDLRVNLLTIATRALIDNNLNDTTIEGLYSIFEQTVANEVAKQNLEVGWVEGLEDTKKVLRWMNSQLEQGASKDRTWNELVSAAKDGEEISGIADVYTRITALENGLLSEAGFNAKVDRAISGIKASTTSEYTSTQIFSKIKQNEDNIAALYTKATGDLVTVGASVDFNQWDGGFITTANINGILAAMVAEDVLNDFKAGIEAMVGDDAIGGHASFQAIAEADGGDAAATIIGLINGEYGSYSSEIKIDADHIRLNGETWAQTLHVEDLIADTIKDSDGNSIQTSYLIDKASERPYCYVTYNNAFTNMSLINDMNINYVNAPQMVKVGDHLLVDFIYNDKYDIRNALKVTMGNEDITSRYCTHEPFAFGGNKVTIEIPSVTGDVEITIKDPVNTAEVRLIYPRMIPVNTSVLGQLICTDESLLPIKTGANVYWYSDHTTTSISADDGYSSTPTVTPSLTGTSKLYYFDEANEEHSFNVSVVGSNTPYIHSFYMQDFEIHVGDIDDKAFTYNINDTIEWENGNGTISSIAFSIPQQYQNIATCTSNGKITPVSVGLFKLECTITYAGFEMSDYCWGWVKPNTFSDSNTYVYCNVDLFGNSSVDNQLVHLPQIKTYSRTWQQGGYKHTTTQAVLLKGTSTKNISYNRSGSNPQKDKHLVYICGWNNCEIDTTTMKPKGYSIEAGTVPSWITNCTLSTGGSDESGNFVYLTFDVSQYSDAITHYREIGNQRNITKDDQYDGTRSGQIKVNAPDGSYLIVTVIQSGKYGFYGELKDNVHNVVSAYCLAPSYCWDRLEWFGNSSEQFIRTNLYPYSIITPQNGYACVAKSSMYTMPHSTMGVMKSEFGETAKLTMNK